MHSRLSQRPTSSASIQSSHPARDPPSTSLQSLHDAARVALDRQSECTTLVRTLDRIVAQLSDASSNAFVTSQHDVDAIQSEAALQKLCTTQAARLKTLKQNVESQRNTLSEQRRKQFEAERLVEEALARVESLTVNLKRKSVILAQLEQSVPDFSSINLPLPASSHTPSPLPATPLPDFAAFTPRLGRLHRPGTASMSSHRARPPSSQRPTTASVRTKAAPPTNIDPDVFAKAIEAALAIIIDRPPSPPPVKRAQMLKSKSNEPSWEIDFSRQVSSQPAPVAEPASGFASRLVQPALTFSAVANELTSLSVMNPPSKVEDALTRINFAACRALDCEHATIYMLHTTATNSTTLDAVASTCPASISLPPNVGLAGACLTSRSAVRVANAQLDNRFFPGIDQVTGIFTHSVICVPIFRRQDSSSDSLVDPSIVEHPLASSRYFARERSSNLITRAAHNAEHDAIKFIHRAHSELIGVLQVINKRSSTGVTLFSYTDELCCHFFASTCAHTIERYHVERDVRLHQSALNSLFALPYASSRPPPHSVWASSHVGSEDVPDQPISCSFAALSLAASRRVSQPPSQSPMALIGAPLWAMSTQLSDLLDCECVHFYFVPELFAAIRGDGPSLLLQHAHADSTSNQTSSTKKSSVETRVDLSFLETEAGTTQSEPLQVLACLTRAGVVGIFQEVLVDIGSQMWPKGTEQPPPGLLVNAFQRGACTAVDALPHSAFNEAVDNLASDQQRSVFTFAVTDHRFARPHIGAIQAVNKRVGSWSAADEHVLSSAACTLALSLENIAITARLKHARQLRDQTQLAQDALQAAEQSTSASSIPTHIDDTRAASSLVKAAPALRTAYQRASELERSLLSPFAFAAT